MHNRLANVIYGFKRIAQLRFVGRYALCTRGTKYGNYVSAVSIVCNYVRAAEQPQFWLWGARVFAHDFDFNARWPWECYASDKCQCNVKQYMFTIYGIKSCSKRWSWFLTYDKSFLYAKILIYGLILKTCILLIISYILLKRVNDIAPLCWAHYAPSKGSNFQSSHWYGEEYQVQGV